MRINRSSISKNIFVQRVLISVFGVTVNVLMAYLMNRLGFQLFLDTVGTIAVSAMGGLFPGILTAVVTNAICALFNVNYIYYGFVNAIIAIFTAWFVRKHAYKKFFKVIGFITFLALFSGISSAFINWYLLDGIQSATNSETVLMFASFMNGSLFWAYFIYTLLLNFLDKGIAVSISWVLFILVPESYRKNIEIGNWKQRPIEKEEIETLNAWGKDLLHTMRFRTTVIIIVTSILLVVVTGWSGIRLYFSKTKDAKTTDALNSLRLVSKIVDKEDVRSIVIEGENAECYARTEKLVKTVVDNFDSVESICFIVFGENKGHVALEVTAKGIAPGEKEIVEYDEKILPYIPQLVEGKNINPIEHDLMKTWRRSVFLPIKDEEGNFICYSVADISIAYMADYIGDFTIRSILILMGFFILVIANIVWYTNTLMVYPIRSMAKCVDDFSKLGFEQEQLDNNVRTIRALDIKTEDEVEKLYKSICTMTLNLSEQMRDLRRLSEATAKMQDGLIITMADMVEKRDSDTGEHIQKTALYVKIIVEGLKKKGYYAEKITPKFMSDVVRSAPLHDIGKINISDGILNKPGKLTDEEFEIMKTHTTAGKKIMEDAISTVEGENYLKEARNMAAYHHERWDGRGYPEGLHGEVIPLSARIMAVADVFDALTSPRVYKPAFPLEKALSIITEESGKQFDPKCVEVFMEALPEVKVVLRKYNNM